SFLYGSEADGRAAWAAISAAGLGAMPDFGFGRCDGHHEMVDLGLRKAPLRTIYRNREPAFRGSFPFGRLVNSTFRWSRLVAGGRPSAPQQMHREADRDRHFAVAAPLARRSICDDRTEPIWWHVADAGQGAGAERAGTGILSLQARNHRGDRGFGRAAVDRRSEKHLPRSHRGGA